MYDEIFDELIEDRVARGADGRPISRDNVVRVPAKMSKGMGVEVPERRGRVIEIYRDARGRVLVDAWDGGSRTFLAADCRRSAAKVSELEREVRESAERAKIRRKKGKK